MTYAEKSKIVISKKERRGQQNMVKTFQYDEVPVLETTSGKLKGYFYDGEYIFKGIPYAQAERFKSEAKRS